MEIDNIALDDTPGDELFGKIFHPGERAGWGIGILRRNAMALAMGALGTVGFLFRMVVALTGFAAVAVMGMSR